MNPLTIDGYCPFCGCSVGLYPHDHDFGYRRGEEPKWTYQLRCNRGQHSHEYHVLNLKEIIDERVLPRRLTCWGCNHRDPDARLCCAGGDQSYTRDMTLCACRHPPHTEVVVVFADMDCKLAKDGDVQNE